MVSPGREALAGIQERGQVLGGGSLASSPGRTRPAIHTRWNIVCPRGD
jgi:hypothetical protein